MALDKLILQWILTMAALIYNSYAGNEAIATVNPLKQITVAEMLNTHPVVDNSATAETLTGRRTDENVRNLITTKAPLNYKTGVIDRLISETNRSSTNPLNLKTTTTTTSLNDRTLLKLLDNQLTTTEAKNVERTTRKPEDIETSIENSRNIETTIGTSNNDRILMTSKQVNKESTTMKTITSETSAVKRKTDDRITTKSGNDETMTETTTNDKTGTTITVNGGTAATTKPRTAARKNDIITFVAIHTYETTSVRTENDTTTLIKTESDKTTIGKAKPDEITIIKERISEITTTETRNGEIFTMKTNLDETTTKSKGDMTIASHLQNNEGHTIITQNDKKTTINTRHSSPTEKTKSDNIMSVEPVAETRPHANTGVSHSPSVKSDVDGTVSEIHSSLSVKSKSDTTLSVKTGVNATATIKTETNPIINLNTGTNAIMTVNTRTDTTPPVKRETSTTTPLKTGTNSIGPVKTENDATFTKKTGTNATSIVKTEAETSPTVTTGTNSAISEKTGTKVSPTFKRGTDVTLTVMTDTNTTILVKNGTNSTIPEKTGTVSTEKTEPTTTTSVNIAPTSKTRTDVTTRVKTGSNTTSAKTGNGVTSKAQTEISTITSAKTETDATTTVKTEINTTMSENTGTNSTPTLKIQTGVLPTINTKTNTTTLVNSVTDAHLTVKAIVHTAMNAISSVKTGTDAIRMVETSIDVATTVKTDGPTSGKTYGPTSVKKGTDATRAVKTSNDVVTIVKTDEPTSVKTFRPAPVKTGEPTSVKTGTDATMAIKTSIDVVTTVKTDGPTSVKTDRPTSVKTDRATSVKTDGPTSVKTNGPTSRKTYGSTSVKTGNDATRAVKTSIDIVTTVKTDGPTLVKTDRPTSVKTGTDATQAVKTTFDVLTTVKTDMPTSVSHEVAELASLNLLKNQTTTTNFVNVETHAVNMANSKTSTRQLDIESTSNLLRQKTTQTDLLVAKTTEAVFSIDDTRIYTTTNEKQGHTTSDHSNTTLMLITAEKREAKASTEGSDTAPHRLEATTDETISVLSSEASHVTSTRQPTDLISSSRAVFFSSSASEKLASSIATQSEHLQSSKASQSTVGLPSSASIASMSTSAECEQDMASVDNTEVYTFLCTGLQTGSNVRWYEIHNPLSRVVATCLIELDRCLNTDSCFSATRNGTVSELRVAITYWENMDRQIECREIINNAENQAKLNLTLIPPRHTSTYHSGNENTHRSSDASVTHVTTTTTAYTNHRSQDMTTVSPKSLSNQHNGDETTFLSKIPTAAVSSVMIPVTADASDHTQRLAAMTHETIWMMRSDSPHVTLTKQPADVISSSRPVFFFTSASEKLAPSIATQLEHLQSSKASQSTVGLPSSASIASMSTSAGKNNDRTTKTNYLGNDDTTITFFATRPTGTSSTQRVVSSTDLTLIPPRDTSTHHTASENTYRSSETSVTHVVTTSMAYTSHHTQDMTSVSPKSLPDQHNGDETTSPPKIPTAAVSSVMIPVTADTSDHTQTISLSYVSTSDRETTGESTGREMTQDLYTAAGEKTTTEFRETTPSSTFNIMNRATTALKSVEAASSTTRNSETTVNNQLSVETTEMNTESEKLTKYTTNSSKTSDWNSETTTMIMPTDVTTEMNRWSGDATTRRTATLDNEKTNSEITASLYSQRSNTNTTLVMSFSVETNSNMTSVSPPTGVITEKYILSSEYKEITGTLVTNDVKTTTELSRGQTTAKDLFQGKTTLSDLFNNETTKIKAGNIETTSTLSENVETTLSESIFDNTTNNVTRGNAEIVSTVQARFTENVSVGGITTGNTASPAASITDKNTELFSTLETSSSGKSSNKTTGRYTPSKENILVASSAIVPLSPPTSMASAQKKDDQSSGDMLVAAVAATCSVLAVICLAVAIFFACYKSQKLKNRVSPEIAKHGDQKGGVENGLMQEMINSTPRQGRGLSESNTKNTTNFTVFMAETSLSRETRKSASTSEATVKGFNDEITAYSSVDERMPHSRSNAHGKEFKRNEAFGNKIEVSSVKGRPATQLTLKELATSHKERHFDESIPEVGGTVKGSCNGDQNPGFGGTNQHEREAALLKEKQNVYLIVDGSKGQATLETGTNESDEQSPSLLEPGLGVGANSHLPASLVDEDIKQSQLDVNNKINKSKTNQILKIKANSSEDTLEDLVPNPDAGVCESDPGQGKRLKQVSDTSLSSSEDVFGDSAGPVPKPRLKRLRADVIETRLEQEHLPSRRLSVKDFPGDMGNL